VTVGIYTFELHLPDARSLKGKRQIVRRLKDRLRARYNVAVAELGDHGALWQRAVLAVVSVANEREALERLFEAVHREVELHVPGQYIETGTEFLQAADGGASGWGEEWK